MRFISEDPIWLAGGINPYVYADDDPINLRDPAGTCPDTEASVETPDDGSSMVGYRIELSIRCRWRFSTPRWSGESANFGKRGYDLTPVSFSRYVSDRGTRGKRHNVMRVSYENEYPERAAVLLERNCPMPEVYVHYGWGHLGDYYEHLIVRSTADVDRPLLLIGIGTVTGGAGAGTWALATGSKAVGAAAARGAAAEAALVVPQGWLYETINCGHGGW